MEQNLEHSKILRIDKQWFKWSFKLRNLMQKKVSTFRGENILRGLKRGWKGGGEGGEEGEWGSKLWWAAKGMKREENLMLAWCGQFDCTKHWEPKNWASKMFYKKCSTESSKKKCSKKFTVESIHLQMIWWCKTFRNIMQYIASMGR